MPLPGRPADGKLFAFARYRGTKASSAALPKSDHIHTIPEAPIESFKFRNFLGDLMAGLDRDINVAARTHVATGGTSEQIGRLDVS